MLTLKGIIKRLQSRLTFTLSRRNSAVLLAYYRYWYHPKQGTLPAFLDAYSKAHPNLTAVQIGANDGFQNDPIHKFIKRDRWRAFLLEPQTDLFNRFLKPLHAHSPHVTPINAALSDQDGSLTLYTIASDERWATGLSSFDRLFVERQIETGIVDEKAAKYGTPMPADKADWIETLPVRTLSPKSLIADYQIGSVDLLQIDTEGLDDKILFTWDLAQRPVNAIVFEHIHLTPERIDKVHDYLTQHHYRWKIYGANTLALHPSQNKWSSFVD